MASTARVDISYRPLRIGWVVRSDDFAAIRKAIRYSHALWGGRFNPIIPADHDEEARQLVDLFRVDVLQPIGDSREVKGFSGKFPHLIRPFQSASIFKKDGPWSSFSWALDIQNTAARWQHKPEWRELRNRLRAYEWSSEDPLADVFLMQLGVLPNEQEVGINYAEMVARTLEPSSFELAPHSAIPADLGERPGVAAIGRFGLERDYVLLPGWDAPGLFLGSAADPRDLMTFWNIRACDIPILFVDQEHLHRYAELLPAWTNLLRTGLAERYRRPQPLGVWSRQHIDVSRLDFLNGKSMLCQVNDTFWNGGTVHAPIMHLGRASALGVMDTSGGVPEANFAFADKPFDSHFLRFGQQHLVASISLIGALLHDEQHTFDIPWIPELNEFYARTMHFDPSRIRVEPEAVGLIMKANDDDAFLMAMPVAALVNRVFSLCGFDSSLSSGGRIARQLLTQLGGVQGARLFKIPGVRSLLRTFGITDTFTRDQAILAIRNRQPGLRTTTFSDHTRLFLEERQVDTPLTPPDVLSFMVRKGLFRMGVKLRCPNCDMTSWVSLDVLQQRVACDLCGHGYDATHQLIDIKWHFRRSGILGTERNAQGAVPVALTLQQLDTTFHSPLSEGLYSPSLDLRPRSGTDLPVCEVDLVWMQPDHQSGKTSIIIAECKDQGPIRAEDFQRDIDNMRRVADAFPAKRFSAYILFVKMAPFTTKEISMLQTLNDANHYRVIILTNQELEPYFPLERRKAELGKDVHVASPSELAHVTAQLYFGADRD